MTDEQPTRPVSEGDGNGADPSSLKGLTDALGIKPAEPGQDPLLGRDIGGVTIVRLIAEGGMGRVYEGLQERPKRKVAVKVMRPGFVSREASVRFGMEFEILGRLRHPCIAHIFSAGMCDVVGCQVPYFVMEYIPDALPITRYAKERMLGIDDRMSLFQNVCEAVAHGHENGVVHRDLKPSNILVEPTGVPKIIDFGIARTIGDTPEKITALTELGQLIGTLQYMSPEQIEADPASIDLRTDVYALGVILYELLTGKRPYEISDKQIVEAARIVREQRPVSPLKLNPQLNSQIVNVAGTCLQKERSKRFANAAELAAAIANCSAPDAIKKDKGGVGSASRPWASDPWSGSSRLAGAVFGLLTIAGFVVGGFMIERMWRGKTAAGRFPPGAIAFQGHTYFFPQERTSQIEARLAAEKLGGALVVVDDAAENEFVTSHAQGPTWLGIGKAGPSWRTLSGGAEVRYFAWDRGQPSNFSGEIAASTSPAGVWHDNFASDNLHYVVEWPDQDGDALPAETGQRDRLHAGVDRSAEVSVIGRWQWFVNGEEVAGNEFMPNGRIKDRPDSSWLLVDAKERRYQFVWAGRAFIDVLTLSPDGKTLQGRNNLGVTVVGRKVK